jgi:PAS domain S-box-containing protein
VPEADVKETSTPGQRGALDRPALDEDAALRFLLEGTARETGEPFFRALVQSLARALGTHGAWVTEYDAARRRLRALAFYLGDRFIPWESDIGGTPCEKVVEGARLVLYPDRVLELYPGDPDMNRVGAVSYMGVPLLESDGSVLGHLAVLDTRPLPEEPRLLATIQLFAERASAELRRLRAEAALREREEKLARLTDGAMDAIVELDGALRVTHVNTAAERLLKRPAARLAGQDFRTFLCGDEGSRLSAMAQALDDTSAERCSTWIAGGLRARAADGREFQGEATLSCHCRGPERFHTLILRDVNDRVVAEERIRSLTVETRVLRAELQALEGFEGILGRSPELLAVLRDVEQVACTDASVLILGETGTGKELVASAVHRASPRREKPLVRLNCAAIPANLVESELFGHEKGAFTGASERRDGRFALADGGTIFLDEVGELSLELQVKLLRVLQEGEFEPVGSSRTRRVDVRVLSATNRDLPAMMKDRKFREDLYYRLSVFPIQLPPLRRRGHDVLLLAEHFAQRFSRKLGRVAPPLTDDCRRRLLAYDWPGNVRELANVIERAVITSRDGRLNLERSLPEPACAAVPGGGAKPEAAPTEAPRIRTVLEIEELERSNLRRALEATRWKISGAGGAAELLGMKPSTLSSRMKALGVQRPI